MRLRQLRDFEATAVKTALRRCMWAYERHRPAV